MTGCAEKSGERASARCRANWIADRIEAGLGHRRSPRHFSILHFSEAQDETSLSRGAWRYPDADGCGAGHERAVWELARSLQGSHCEQIRAALAGYIDNGQALGRGWGGTLGPGVRHYHRITGRL
jgi:hypothetical protein